MFGSQHLKINAKQLYHLSLEGGTCELAAPAPELSRVIDYYWLLTIKVPSLVLKIIPDAAVDLVVSPNLSDFAALYFPVSTPYEITLEGPVQYSGVCFRAESVSEILGPSVAALKQLSIGKETLESLQLLPLLRGVRQYRSISTLTKFYNQFWQHRLAQVPVNENSGGRITHRELIAALDDAMGSDSLAEICESLEVSERQFRRLSVDLFGLSPKKLQRILRLQAALSELFHADANQLRDLYYDDSHRIRELKRLTGYTPGQKRRLAEKYNR
jgi:AraC-like DNA-binding protein